MLDRHSHRSRVPRHPRPCRNGSYEHDFPRSVRGPSTRSRPHHNRCVLRSCKSQSTSQILPSSDGSFMLDMRQQKQIRRGHSSRQRFKQFFGSGAATAPRWPPAHGPCWRYDISCHARTASSADGGLPGSPCDVAALAYFVRIMGRAVPSAVFLWVSGFFFLI